MLIFDLESAGLPLEDIKRTAKPFSAPPAPGVFDPSAVKVGNLKDEAKIREKIDAARRDHEAAVASHATDCQRAEAAYWQGLVDKAPLSPVTGRVVAIGCWSAAKGSTLIIGEPPETFPEQEILATFWRLYRSMRQSQRKMVGLNIAGFDLPFLVRRSWILGVDVPTTVRNGRWWDQLFVDLRDEWLLGQRWGDCESSLDHIAKALGIGSKADAEGCDGATFGKLWLSGNAEDRAKARGYLVNDLELTRKAAERIGVV